MDIIQKFKSLLIIVPLLFTLPAQAQWSGDVSGTFEQARKTHTKILLVFSGSDWCAACIRFEKNILEDQQFRQFATEYLMVVKADFPQRIKQPDNIVQQNEALAGKYNPDGKFPTILLLDPDGAVAGSFDYSNEDVGAFLAFLKKYIL